MAEAAAERPEVRADQSVATRFTRLMNATTSPWGMLTDPPLVALASAIGLIAFLAALGTGAGPVAVRAIAGLAALPIATAVVLSLALIGARGRVVAWLARQPFPIDNMNAILNGLGESLEITFAGAIPGAEELNPVLDAVHPDAFVTASDPDARAVEVRIGVVDSKRNPAKSNHERYVRVIALVERALVPAAERWPIEGVRVK